MKKLTVNLYQYLPQALTIMDLQDFKSDMLYFDEPLSPTVDNLLRRAAENYGTGNAERLLLEAFQMARDNLSVLVGLYRFYYYQHRYGMAIEVAHHVMAVVAPRIDFPPQWREITMTSLSNGVLSSIGMVRFYLFALKAAGYLNLRVGRFEEGLAMLKKVVELDTSDRLGARLLLEIVGSHNADVIPFPAQPKKMEARP